MALLVAVLLLAAGYVKLYAKPAVLIEQAQALAREGDFAGEQAMYAALSEETVFGSLPLTSLPIGRCREVPELYQQSRYREAEDLMARGKYDRASRSFAELGDYRDAADRVYEPYYVQGGQLEAQGDFAGAASAYEQAEGYADAGAADSYCRGRIALEEGRYAEAETLLMQAGNHGDAEALLEQNAPLAAGERDAQARKAPYRERGHVLEWGRYEQDGEAENGAEPIRWHTIASEGDRVMLLCENVLDCMPYNGFMIIPWEQSELRAWLNGQFLAAAFTEEERAALTGEPVDPAGQSRFGEAEQPLCDLVTLLERTQFTELVSDTEEASAAGTAYAKARGLTQQDGKASWWLRTDGYEGDDAALIDANAKRQNVRVDEKGVGVRPVIWVDLNALGV